MTARYPARAARSPPGPRWGGRVGRGVGTAVAIALLGGYLPFYLLTRGPIPFLRVGYSPFLAFVWVPIIAAIQGLAIALKTTRAYGPATIVAALAEICLLYYLIARVVFTISPGGGIEITITCGAVLAFLVTAAVLTEAEGAVALAEDLWRPGERVRWGFQKYFSRT